MNSGSIVVEWNAAGRLDIKTTFSIGSGDGKKAAIEKLLDAARAVNNQGTPLVMPPTSSVRLLTEN